MTAPTIGRIVTYTMPGSTPQEPKVRPAIVVEAWPGSSHVNLEVFLSPEDVRDLSPTEMKQAKFRSSVTHSAGYPARPGEWQWPPLRDVALEKLPEPPPPRVYESAPAGAPLTDPIVLTPLPGTEGYAPKPAVVDQPPRPDVVVRDGVASLEHPGPGVAPSVKPKPGRR